MTTMTSRKVVVWVCMMASMGCTILISIAIGVVRTGVDTMDGMTRGMQDGMIRGTTAHGTDGDTHIVIMAGLDGTVVQDITATVDILAHATILAGLWALHHVVTSVATGEERQIIYLQEARIMALETVLTVADSSEDSAATRLTREETIITTSITPISPLI